MMNFKKISISFLIVLFCFFTFAASSYSVELTHFTGFKSTDKSGAYAGKVTIDNVDAVDNEDEVGVFVSNGSNDTILVGACVMGNVMAGHYFVNVYGDDTTTDEKDGASNNEELIFKIWDQSEDQEYLISSMTYESSAGLTEPAIPPVWTASATYGLLNLAATTNHPPVLNSIGNKTVAENEELSFVVSGSDPDDDNIVFSTGTLPDSASFDANTGTFTWKPGYDEAGEYQVQFIVTDDGQPNKNSSEEITITVNNVNRPPVLGTIDNKSVDENTQIQFLVTGEDPDADNIVFSTGTLPIGASFDADTGTFTWKPDYNDAGQHQVQFTATDNGSPSLNDSQTITITVNEVNRTPSLGTIGNKVINEGEQLYFVITANDPDNNNLTFSIDTLPSGAFLNPQTGTFEWTPGHEEEGEHQIKFTVTDNGNPALSDSENIVISVFNAPAEFTDTITLTDVVMDIYGYFNIGENTVDKNDEIGVFDSNGTLCGVFIITTPGEYGVMHIYGDDSTTDDIKEGPVEGEALTMKIYDISEDKVFVADIINSEFTFTPKDFLPDGIAQFDFKAVLKQKIPLHKGWNLISFGVNKCYYVGNKPTVDMLEDIEYEQVSSINDILTSIDGQYSYIRGFDATGAKSYNLSPWSDMRYMSAGYGYWIKIKDDAEVDANGFVYLELEGIRISGSKSIPLHSGWNLVGYLGNKAQYMTSEEPNVHFPGDAVKESISGIGDAFSSIDSKYSYVRGFDATGAKSYNLSPWSDMKYVGPGYGYWIKVNAGESPNLVWED
ncbi:exported hypothetical protein [Candidatus Magnetomoraceae bacterium gMMP-1]